MKSNDRPLYKHIRQHQSGRSLGVELKGDRINWNWKLALKLKKYSAQTEKRIVQRIVTGRSFELKLNGT